MVQIIARASAALLCLVVAVGANRAEAEFFDSEGELRFGVFAQGAFLGLDVTQTAPVSGVSLSQDGRLDGFSYGASVGYDMVLSDAYILGIEADIALGEVTKRFTNSRFDMDYLVSIRGRAGRHVGDNWIAYATAGVAFLGLENAPSPLLGLKNSATMTGGIAGFGVEYEREYLTLFGEYLYARFEDWKFGNMSGFYDVSSDIHMLRFGVKFTSGHNHYEDEYHGRY